jgi:hypothetical protein
LPGCLEGGHGHAEGRRRGQATWSALIGQGLAGGQVAAGAMHASAWWHGRLHPVR